MDTGLAITIILSQFSDENIHEKHINFRMVFDEEVSVALNS